MIQIKTILERLKNPSVVLSISAQIISILVLFKVNIDVTLVEGILTAGCSILVLLGIMSNPTTETKGYKDDIYLCSHCNKPARHVKVNNEMVCVECGCPYKNPQETSEES